MAFAGASLLAGCDTGYDDSQFGPLKDYYNHFFGGGMGLPITRAQIEQQPYAMIGVNNGGKRTAIMVLANIRGAELHWISADRTIIATRGGRLVRTVGLPENIRETRPLGRDPVVDGLHRTTAGATAKRIMDFDNSERYGRVVESQYRPVERQNVTIADLTYELLLVVEENRIAVEDWDFENKYWVDPITGFVWKSLQYIDPKFSPFEISVLKPADV